MEEKKMESSDSFIFKLSSFDTKVLNNKGGNYGSKTTYIWR